MLLCKGMYFNIIWLANKGYVEGYPKVYLKHYFKVIYVLILCINILVTYVRVSDQLSTTFHLLATVAIIFGL